MNYKHITINEKCCIANFLDLGWSIRKIAKYMNRNVVSPQTMVVNPNYLNEFPIYDSSNNKIEISEDERDWVILVPDIYIEKENNIKKYL